MVALTTFVYMAYHADVYTTEK